jgi:pimeloyl-ACP methyl ester carboxylesterase
LLAHRRNPSADSKVPGSFWSGPAQEQEGQPLPVASIRLVFLTRGATTSDSGAPAAAAVRGLVRSAQDEGPGRFVLVDTDGSKASWRALVKALATDEDQVVLRRSTVPVPRLVQAGPPEEAYAASEDRADEPEATGTTLITGGAGHLGDPMPPLTPRTHADDLAPLLKSLADEPALVFGTSLGSRSGCTCRPVTRSWWTPWWRTNPPSSCS